LVPLLVLEEASSKAMALYRQDPAMLVWWATEVELVSALTRLEREGALEPPEMAQALSRLESLKLAWHEVLPSQEVRDAARRFLRVHPLRAMDALQLAAAFVASGGKPTNLPFLSFDMQLLVAAEREGFPIIA
jgi:predicted nucleic acid-binding protein